MTVFCERTQPHLLDYVNGRLEGEARAVVEQHLSRCKRCRLDAAALRSLVATLRSQPTSAPPAPLLHHTQQRIAGEKVTWWPFWRGQRVALVVVVLLMAGLLVSGVISAQSGVDTRRQAALKAVADEAGEAELVPYLEGLRTLAEPAFDRYLLAEAALALKEGTAATQSRNGLAALSALQRRLKTTRLPERLADLAQRGPLAGDSQIARAARLLASLAAI